MIDQKLLAYLSSLLTEHRRERFENVLAQRTKFVTVAIEDVYQLHNTSAVIRSCDVFGIQDLHIIEERNIKKIDREIAMGAQKWVDIHRHHSVEDCIASVRAKGYKIIATTPHKNETLLQDFKISEKTCFFFGRETEGLSDTVLEQADGFLKIPMHGFTESLNISVSAAIILQHVIHALKQSELSWQLTDLEKQEKTLDWIQKTIRSYDDIVKHYYSR